MIVLSVGDVEVSNEASVLVLGLVSLGSVNGDHGMVVAERGERWDQPSDGVGVLVSSSVLPWGCGGEVLSVEGDTNGGAGRCESHENVVSNNIDIVVEDDVKVKADIASNLRWAGSGCAGGNIVAALGVALGP
jgi:hypothetical protein